MRSEREAQGGWGWGGRAPGPPTSSAARAPPACRASPPPPSAPPPPPPRCSAASWAGAGEGGGGARGATDFEGFSRRFRGVLGAFKAPRASSLRRLSDDTGLVPGISLSLSLSHTHSLINTLSLSPSLSCQMIPGLCRDLTVAVQQHPPPPPPHTHPYSPLPPPSLPAHLPPLLPPPPPLHPSLSLSHTYT